MAVSAVFSQSPPKGAGKWCRAKIVEKCRKNFLTIFDDFCPALKLSKSVEKLLDAF